jgi:hypothetical protein
MNHPEFFYLDAGYRYERLTDPARRIERGKEIRAILDAEPAAEREMVRSLIQRGRQEYQQRGRA